MTMMRDAAPHSEKKPVRRMADIRSVRKKNLLPNTSDVTLPRKNSFPDASFGVKNFRKRGAETPVSFHAPIPATPSRRRSPVSTLAPSPDIAEKTSEETGVCVEEGASDASSRKNVSGEASDKPSFGERAASRWFSFASSFSFISGIFGRKRAWTLLLSTFFLIGSVWFGFGIFRQGMKMKGEVLGASTVGYGELSRAIDTAKSRDFSSSEKLFQSAFVSFSNASGLFDRWNGTVIEAARFLPIVSQLSSGKYLVDAARDISSAGEAISSVGGAVVSLGNPLSGEKNTSFLEAYRRVRGGIDRAETLLSDAEENLDKVAVADLPEDKRDTFLRLKTTLPEAISGMRLFLSHGDIFTDILGGNGPRKFLFLFQNNQEARATGGFIGSYAFLDVNDGRIRKFFVDGIFNPDGQLHEDIVPPAPIQKISAGWSLHDSNWFPNFPTSAEKAILFYEKTGGPTVDGVIAFTPEILKKFLEITGPIFLEKYGITVDENNFLESIQYQVEVAYDREENKPKQILADLAPILLDRVFGEDAAPGAFGKVLSAVESGLSEKHVLFYSRNRDLERLMSDAGWSGEVLPSERDYVSVINANINGYKTDGVIDETISHRANIQDDGSVIDTVSVKRVHRGGNTGREWWDKVNADYMRVYVPRGSILLSAEGQTREIDEPPLDYAALRFSRDPDIEREEKGMSVDPVSGTRISEDAGKTVFGNWVYVSPGETVEVTYTYRLPFRVDPASVGDGLAPYSVVFQKQSGSKGSSLFSEVKFPNRFRPVWQSGENLIPSDGGFHMETDLAYDRFLGILFD